MRTLLIDNYDSYTFNLFQLLAQVNRAAPIVVPNDCRWDDIAALDVDNVVLSPGPGAPTRPRDAGICIRVVEECSLPILGVCLGHQIIATVRGGAVRRAPSPAHGVVSRMYHDGSELFAGVGVDVAPRHLDGALKGEFHAVRYHSLVALEPLGDGLVVSARTDDGLVMALRDPTRPVWGVQFHPESILTPDGSQLLENFRDQTLAWQEGGPRKLLDGRLRDRRPRDRRRASHAPGADAPSMPFCTASVRQVARCQTITSRIDAEAVVAWLLATDPEGNAPLLWLDSASHSGAVPNDECRRGNVPRKDQRDRFSYIALPGGPLAQTVTYDAASATITIDDRSGRREQTGDVLEWLRCHMPQVAVPEEDPASGRSARFWGGFVGYFGYDLFKVDRRVQRSSRRTCDGDPPKPSPDAAVVFVDRLLVVDHARNEQTLVWLGPADEPEGARRWFAETEEALSKLATPPPAPFLRPEFDTSDLSVAAHRAWHAHAVRSCREALAAGDSYELCLTTQFPSASPVDHFAAYQSLRRRTPAPFGALLHIGSHWVLSASPEQLLSVAPQHPPQHPRQHPRQHKEVQHASPTQFVTTRPIKGTAPRGVDTAADAQLATALRQSTKDRSEHLMIVDLVRNDLGSVSVPGSVVVEELMVLEHHPDVHQMVSTVVGQLRGGAEAVDALRALFPPGSMTGAPKRRTIELLDDLETTPRGIYGGALGWLGVGGSAELSVVIRTIVSDGTIASVGAGGAIVWQSRASTEYEELLLKARAPLAALADERLARGERQSSR